MDICIIDVSGLMYRAFYGTPSMQYNGQEVGALFGFCSEIISLKPVFGNAKIFASLDCSKKTFRNDIYPKYKENRKSMPETLLLQCQLIHEACESFGFKILKKHGYEADDIIATCVKHFHTDNSITIVSTDKDLLQLLSIDNVRIYNPSKHCYITEEYVVKKFGVKPCQLIDLLSLMGDASDNIPGVPGIGIKTASKLLNEYGGLDTLILNLNQLQDTSSVRKIRQNIENALLSKRLVELCHSVELEFSFDNMFKQNIVEFLGKYNFASLINRLKRQNNQLHISR